MTAASTETVRRRVLEPHERLDDATGVIERLAFLGEPGEQIFSVTAMPPGPILGGVVMAPSLLTDRIRLYRGEVRVARRLAALGYAVVRFDYRGFGHSDGATGDATAARLSADLEMAVTSLRTILNGGPVTLLGSRFGSLPVANASAPVERSIMWDPVLTGRDYFRTAFRAHLIGGMQRDGSSKTPTAQLKEDGHASVLGYTVTRGLVEGTNDLSLLPAEALANASVLWIESTEMSKSRNEAVEHLRESVSDLRLAELPSDDSGWFVGVRPFESREAEDTIVEWLRGLET